MGKRSGISALSKRGWFVFSYQGNYIGWNCSELKLWAKECCDGRFAIGSHRSAFEMETDAIMFSLRWLGNK